jgi:hypothetical protein
VRVRLHWRLHGAIGATPGHGVYLGSYTSNGTPVAYEDASVLYPAPDMLDAAAGTRTLNTLYAIELTHTFTGGETGAYLRIYLADPESGPVATTVHVDSVIWSGGGTSSGAAGSTGTAGGGGGGDSGRGGASGSGGSAVCPHGVDFRDGTLGGLVLGPHNNVFSNPTIASGPITNYANQVIFAGPVLSLPAMFPQRMTVAPDPSSGTALDPWLGELSLVPATCERASLAGRTVRVRLLWRLTVAIGPVPAHGVYLGSYTSNGNPVAYPDASLLYPGPDAVDATAGTRTLNTLTHSS